MLIRKFFAVVLFVLLLGTGLVAAQDEPDGLGDRISGAVEARNSTSESEATELTGYYAHIPQERTEDGAFVLGDPDAPVTIIEFADFACPHCQNYKPTVDQFIEEYVETGRARYEFRLFPTAGGQMTVVAGVLAECADELQPGAFWTAHELFYELGKTSRRYNERMGLVLADALDLDYDALIECALEADQYINDIEFGEANGVGGTPAILARIEGGDPIVIEVDGVVYDRGGVPFEALAAFVEMHSPGGGDPS